jgi:hypothetical protein
MANVDVVRVADRIWLVSFMEYDLGFFDHESVRVECAPNPFEAKVLRARVIARCVLVPLEGNGFEKARTVPSGVCMRTLDRALDAGSTSLATG